MAFFEEAKREAVPLIIAIAGPSGSGKTYSALMMAAGIAGPSGRVGLIDTELGRGSMYADDPDICAAMPSSKYLIHPMPEPFTPEKYGEGIKQAAAAGVTVLVVDSMSHEWEGFGGCQDIAENNKLRGLPNWALAKLKHKRLMNQLGQTPMHIIFCLRAREKTKPGKDADGKTIMVEMGMQPIQEKNFMYEMTVSMMLDDKTHLPVITKCPKPLLALFGEAQGLITPAVGVRLRQWSEEGAPIDNDLRSLQQQCRDAAMSGSAALDKFFSTLGKPEKAALKTASEEFKKAVRELAEECDRQFAGTQSDDHPIPNLPAEIIEAMEEATRGGDVFTRTTGGTIKPTSISISKPESGIAIGQEAAAVAVDLFGRHEADYAVGGEPAKPPTDEELARQDYIAAGHPVIEDVVLSPDTQYATVRANLLKKIANSLLTPSALGLDPTPDAFEMFGGRQLTTALDEKALGDLGRRIRQVYGA